MTRHVRFEHLIDDRKRFAAGGFPPPPPTPAIDDRRVLADTLVAPAALGSCLNPSDGPAARSFVPIDSESGPRRRVKLACDGIQGKPAERARG